MLHDTTQAIDGVSYTFQSSGVWLQQEMAPAVSITKEQAEQRFYATYAIIENEMESGVFCKHSGDALSRPNDPGTFCFMG